MALRPVSFVKEHPLGFIVSAATGMVVGPAVLGMIGKWTGVNVSLPSVGS